MKKDWTMALQLFAEGGEAAPQGETAGQEGEGDPGGEFERLITGQYKDAFDKRVSDAVNRRLQAMERDGAKRDKLEREHIQRQAGMQYALWTRQAEEAQRLYPSLDLGVEAKNPQFRQLLRAGVDVGSAYLVVHKDDILPAAMQHAARVVEQKLAGKLQAGSARPAENAMTSQAPALTKSDVTQLTRADREEIRRRAIRGEKIRFS